MYSLLAAFVWSTPARKAAYLSHVAWHFKCLSAQFKHGTFELILELPTNMKAFLLSKRDSVSLMAVQKRCKIAKIRIAVKTKIVPKVDFKSLSIFILSAQIKYFLQLKKRKKKREGRGAVPSLNHFISVVGEHAVLSSLGADFIEISFQEQQHVVYVS